MKEYAIITFKPINKKVVVRKGTDLLTAMVKGNIFITSSCEGKGVCGRCRVKILKGEFKTEPTGKISENDRKNNIFLACRTIILGNIEVEILPETLLTEKEIKEKRLFARGEEFHLAEVPLKEIYPFSPLSQKYFLRLSLPSLEDNVSDFERICRELKKYKGEKFECETDLPTLRRLPALLRGSNWEITTTVVEKHNRKEIIIVEPRDNSRRNYGVAVDVGTTTIAASLIDLRNGENLKTEISFNKQSSYGEDIISRIIYAEKGEGLETLHHLVCETINELIQNLSENCSINLNDITCIVCSGNMTMTHLLLKINPSFLRKEP
ncbi:2Fe-2S iron-sulfur cluster binding domain-containing protein [bacterium]|nr:2Fe-2S iron-sulfur cluster binding domain-containing protein [bacterium]